VVIGKLKGEGHAWISAGAQSLAILMPYILYPFVMAFWFLALAFQSLINETVELRPFQEEKENKYT
jgi:hypothetical protein